MKVYFANMLGAKGIDKYLRFDIDVLAAYPSFPKTKPVEKPKFCRHLFLDSGAFTKERDKITLDGYEKFIKTYENQFEVYANLDVIGDLRGTWKNQKKLEKRGLKPIPVFHYSAPTKYLEKCIFEYDYFALGGLVPISGNYFLMRSWLDRVWGVIQKLSSDVKVHGFGIQNLDIAKRYPWYSIDSSSVHTLARYGGIYTPWGAYKINPNVNGREVKWIQLNPSSLVAVEKFVNSMLDNFNFAEAQKQDTEGTLIRCAVSIHYIMDYLNNSENTDQINIQETIF